jgi:hypothetical protein
MLSLSPTARQCVSRSESGGKTPLLFREVNKTGRRIKIGRAREIKDETSISHEN